MQHRIARFWARSLVIFELRCSKLKVQGEENLRRHPVAVYASNHTSYMDMPVVFAALPFQFRILARKELWPIAFIGWYLIALGSCPSIPGTRAPRSPAWEPPRRPCAPACLFLSFPRAAHPRRRAADLPLRRSLPRYPRPGSACAHRARGVYDLMPIHTRHFYPGTLTFTARPANRHRRE